MSLTIRITNFKSIKDASLTLRKGLNILIGPNGSGKTCVMSSLKFVHNLFRFGAAQALARSGGRQRVYRRGKERISFSIDEDYEPRTCRRKKVACRLHWEVTIGQAGPEGIATVLTEKYSITALTRPHMTRLFSVEVDRARAGRAKTDIYLSEPRIFGRDLFSTWKQRYPGKKKKRLSESFNKVVPNNLRRYLKEYPDKSIFPSLAILDKTTHAILNQFLILNEYNILPDVARASTEQLPFATMDPDGGSVSEVIYALQNEHYHRLINPMETDFGDIVRLDRSSHYPYYRSFYPSIYYYRRASYMSSYRQASRFQSVLHNINAEVASAVHPISGVDIRIDPTSGRRFIVFKAGKYEFHPEEVFDGTVKWLCILVSLFVPVSRVYLLEEPENFLHPWMQQRLIEIMRDQARQNGTAFLLSSHSSTVLNAALPEEVLVVTQDDEGTHLTQLAQRDDIARVLSESDFQLGDLWVSGVLGGTPSHG